MTTVSTGVHRTESAVETGFEEIRGSVRDIQDQVRTGAEVMSAVWSGVNQNETCIESGFQEVGGTLQDVKDQISADRGNMSKAIYKNTTAIQSGFEEVGSTLQFVQEGSAANRESLGQISASVHQCHSTIESGFQELESRLEDIRDHVATDKTATLVMNVKPDFFSPIIDALVQTAVAQFRKEFLDHTKAHSTTSQVLQSTKGQIMNSNRPRENSKCDRETSERFYLRRRYNFHLGTVIIESSSSSTNDSRTLSANSERVRVHFNIPGFRRGFCYTKENLYQHFSGGISRSLRSYNVVSA
jgi:prophage DNA circulation protein